MSLAYGHPYLAIPGPSVIPDRVQRAMHRGSPNIYEGALLDLVDSLWPDLRRVAGTTGHCAAYIGNGHGGWEAATANLFSRGEKALVLATGSFGHSWANHARGMGIEAELIDFGKQTPADPGQLEAALRADKEGKIKAILVTHVDTATTVRNDIAALRKAIDAAGHSALLAVDCIASMGCDEYRMDEWGADVTVAACQKGLMTPPGLALVWFNEKARARSKGSDLASPYWNWEPRVNPGEFYHLWDGTAPTAHLYGLREALTMLVQEEGLSAAWHRHDVLARTVWAAFDAWNAGNPQIAMNVALPEWRGRSVTAARFGAPHATALREWCEHRAGVTLGIGLGMAASDDPAYHGFLRVAHMGHVNAHMTLGALAVMDAGLKALNLPHGAGALEAAAHVVAQGA